MSQVRLILALHNHQPVGNFDGVFEDAYRTSYLPFLDVLEDYPEIPFVLHTSGPLLEWLVDRHPEYIARARGLVEAGPGRDPGRRVLRADPDHDPERDRVGQIRAFSAYLNETLRRPGARDVDRRAGLGATPGLGDRRGRHRVHGPRRLPLPARRLLRRTTSSAITSPRTTAGCSRSSRGRDAPLHHPVPRAARDLRIPEAAGREPPGATVVFADDGEKFGSWPETFDHVYTNGWLSHFCDMLRANRDWIETTTFARAVDATLPLGKVYLPDGSYREMTEWALPSRVAAGVSRWLPSVWPRCRRRRRSSGSSGPAGSGATSRRGIPRATRCTRGCSASRGGWPRSRRTRCRPRLPGSRPPGALPRPVQLPLLARVVRRPLSAPPQERDLPRPDRRAQRARRRRGRVGPARRARGRRLQPRRPPGSPPGERPPDRLGPARARGPRLRAGRPRNATNLLATLDRRPEAYHADILAAAADRGDGQERIGARRPDDCGIGLITSSKPGSTIAWSTTAIRARRSSIISTRSM